MFSVLIAKGLMPNFYFLNSWLSVLKSSRHGSFTSGVLDGLILSLGVTLPSVFAASLVPENHTSFWAMSPVLFIREISFLAPMLKGLSPSSS